MHTARRGDGTCPALGIKEEKLPPPSHPDFLGTQDDIIFFCWQSRTSLGLQNNGIFILAELKKSYIYLHRSKNNEIYFFLNFILHIFIDTAQPNRDSGIRCEVGPQAPPELWSTKKDALKSVLLLLLLLLPANTAAGHFLRRGCSTSPVSKKWLPNMRDYYFGTPLTRMFIHIKAETNS